MTEKINTLSDLLVSYIRTGVAIGVGVAAAWLLKHTAFSLDPAKIDVWLEPLCIGVYYSAVRSAEHRWPAVGWLLGVAKQPKYPPPPVKL